MYKRSDSKHFTHTINTAWEGVSAAILPYWQEYKTTSFFFLSPSSLKWGSCNIHDLFVCLSHVSLSISLSLLSLLTWQGSIRSDRNYINWIKSKPLRTTHTMYAEHISARTQHKTTVLNLLGKQGHLNTGSCSIAGIMWRIAMTPNEIWVGNNIFQTLN